ncbi:MAG: hypothetical protein FJ291_24825 [Planctomycetes bacterium]|nr:hypothetical protein [Planctomycetota bacterium]
MIVAGLVGGAWAAQKSAAAKAQEAAAERLYAEAVRFFGRQQLFELRSVLERLAKAHPDSAAVADAERKPSYAEMLKAVEGVGRFLVVRRDGAGGAFRRIQDAIAAAIPNSTIEVQDEGPYAERLVVPEDKTRLTLRGKKPLWPVIAAAGQAGGVDALVALEGAEATLERLVISHAAPGGGQATAVAVRRGPCSLRGVVVYAKEGAQAAALTVASGARCELEACVLSGNALLEGETTLRDSLWLRCDEGGLHAKGAFKAENSVLFHVLTSGPGELRNCTVTQGAAFKGAPSLALDCILYRVEAAREDATLDFCDVYPGGFLGAARPGKGCFSADPRFVNPKTPDCRLAPASPCRKKGSDGGDVGCRPTTELGDLAKKALDLRQRGLIAF